MVKKLLVFILLSVAIIFISYSPEYVNASSYAEINIGNPPEDAGECIASKVGFQVIEFWHYSGGYWKATLITGSGKKELTIRDNEANDGIWTRPLFLEKKIHQNNFVLEYKMWHPQEVLDALAAGAKITPVMSIDTGTLNISEAQINSGIYVPMKFFNFTSLSEDLPNNLPEKPEYIIHDNYLEIHALPILNCQRSTLKNKVYFYPYEIPLVQPGFGSLSYSLYHHDSSYAGVGYSPDPFYKDMNTIEYGYIKNIQGELKSGYSITTASYPERKDEDSGELRIGYNTFANAGAVSIRFWYPIKIDYYAKATTTPTPTSTPTTTPTPTPTIPPSETTPGAYEEQRDTEEIIGSLDPQSNCVIKADERGNEIFDVSLGIPVRENLYVNATAKEYLYKYGFTEHTYTGSEVIRVKKTYKLKWQEDDGYNETEYCGSGIMYHVRGTYCTDADGDGIKDSCPGHPYNGCEDTDGDDISDYCPGHTIWVENWVDKTGTEVKYSPPHTVTRNYSYRTINNFELFVPDSITVQNAALPGGSVSINASGLTLPVVNLSHSSDIAAHVLKDPFQYAKDNGDITYDRNIGSYVIDLGRFNLDGGTSKPEVPEITDHAARAENVISGYHVRNDSLIFNGRIILDNEVSETGIAKEPKSIPEAGLCNNNVFYKNRLLIPDRVLNGVHESSGRITYKKLANAVNPTLGETIEKDLSPINSVRVHTPVVCNTGVYDDIQNDQSINPDENRAAVILGRPTKIRVLSTGEHLDIPGYNKLIAPNKKEMDCSKYTRQMQVRFPFDIYIGTDKMDNSCFLPANNWYIVPEQGIMDLYVPDWVPEGDYDVEFRQIAVNAPDTSKTQNLANTDISNYVAVRTSKVRIIGRLYGFKITDVTDTLWEDVFRVSRNSAAHTGNYYYVGTKNEDGEDRGISSLFTLPLLEGSHALYKNRGALKTGYTFRFELETVGGYFGENDYIQITPRFYYVKRDGTGRQEVTLWYHEEFNGKTNYFVPIEPQGKNRDNPLYMTLGDRYRNVPDESIKDTARLLGLNENSFKNKKESIGWFDKIILSKFQRTFTGSKENLPYGVNEDTSIMSRQKWYGEYNLPNDLFVTTLAFDVPDYGRTHYGLNGKEDFWLKDGYIIVNFSIEAVKNNNFEHPSLSYWGSPRCNMFTREGFNKEKTDYYQKEFILMDGDIVFYDTDKRSTDDYGIGGTH